MFILMFALWIIFNGRITPEIALIGLAVSALVFLFLCRYMGYSLKKEIGAYRSLLGGIQYIWLLVCEIFKANFYVMKLILSSKYIVEPKLLRFRTGLKGETSRVVLANSITLTPGTITVNLEGDEYLVHCLDRELGEGIENCSFVERLERLEEESAARKAAKEKKDYPKEATTEGKTEREEKENPKETTTAEGTEKEEKENPKEAATAEETKEEKGNPKETTTTGKMERKEKENPKKATAGKTEKKSSTQKSKPRRSTGKEKRKA